MKKMILKVMTFILAFLCFSNTVFAIYELPEIVVKNGIEFQIDESKGYAVYRKVIEGIEKVIFPEYVNGYPVNYDKLKIRIRSLDVKEISLPPTLKTVPNSLINGSYNCEAIYIPKSVNKIEDYAFGTYGSLTLHYVHMRKKIHIYYEGSETQWKEISKEEDITKDPYDKVLVIHYNSTGIGEYSDSAEKKVVENKFSIYPRSGLANISKNDKTGTKFTFTAITSADVKEISIAAKKKDGTYHEISYDYLHEYYGLTSVSNGIITNWTCKIRINEPNFASGVNRRFKLIADGVDTGLRDEVEVLPNKKIIVEYFSVKPRTGGKANKTENDKTGTKFTFTAITSANVDEISICAKKKDGTYHEIPYEYLCEHYSLTESKPWDGPQGKMKTWTCKIRINEPNFWWGVNRRFKLLVDGQETEFRAEAEVLPYGGSFSPTPQQ